MKKFVNVWSLMIVAMCLLSLTIAGCDQPQASPSPGRVAVVDIAHVAKASGFEDTLAQMVNQAQQQEQNQLMAMQKQLGLDVPPAENPTPEQITQYNQSSMQLRQAYEEAQTRIQNMQFTEMENFRSTLRPIAERVAFSRGFSIVMELRDNILSLDPAADITTDVIAAMTPLSGTPTEEGTSQSTAPAPASGNQPATAEPSSTPTPAPQPPLKPAP